MKPKEVSAGLSGVISTASWENFRPSYTITAEVEEGENVEDCLVKLRSIVRKQFDAEANQARIDLIEKQYKNIRFREKDGKKYPSVTSILSWDKDWKISDDELQQYAARGTIVHKLIEIYIETGEWVKPDTLPELKEDLIILATGNLKLSWQDCSHKEFFAQFGKDFEWLEGEQEVYNEENLYSGCFDRLALYKGLLTIVDWKTGTSFSHSQTAAYAVAYHKKIENLVICPVGVCKNKTGTFKPNVSENIEGNFQKFLKARAKFHKRFGI